MAQLDEPNLHINGINLAEGITDFEVMREMVLLRAFVRICQITTRDCDLETALCVAVVRLGNLEGRPYDLTALAEACAISRQSASRKMNKWGQITKRLRWIGGGGKRRIAVVTPPQEWRGQFDEIAATFQRACDLLSILDHARVESDEPSK